jgi:hypothetical protein
MEIIQIIGKRNEEKKSNVVEFAAWTHIEKIKICRNIRYKEAGD